MNTEILKLEYNVVNSWIINNYNPPEGTDCILTVLNGAKQVGELLSTEFDIYQQFVTIKSYNNENSQESIKLIGEFPKITEKRVLVVDDIYDTGNTLEYTLNELIKYDCVERIDIYTVIKKNRPENRIEWWRLRNKRRVMCNIDYSCLVPATTWIKFPWE